MIYQGQCITVKALDNGIAELCFDAQGSVNKFDQATVQELKEAGAKLVSESGITGLIITSAKSTFIVGADIMEFTSLFEKSAEEIAAWTVESNQAFNAIEDLPFPTVAAINGMALGGGFEMALTADFRIMGASAQVGLPETQLGIFPGFGGTVRMSRLVGVDNAVEWIAAGKHQRADKALKVHAVDAVVADEQLRDAALDLLGKAIAGEIDYQTRRSDKKGTLKLNKMEATMAFQTNKAGVFKEAGKNYPSPMLAVTAIEEHGFLERDEALKVEAKYFAQAAKTPQAKALVGVFINDQYVKKVIGKWEKQSTKVDQAAVLGAGTMGGGIAYQSASKGTPIIMKDINDDALEVGMHEAAKLLSKLVDRGRMKPLEMGKVLSAIRPTLNYGDFSNVNLVVEAVVENPKIKKIVLKEVEEKTERDDVVITSNTSTISIDLLAEDLEKPEQFAGMHFFNPVHKMPLVEIIRGAKTSDETIATVVAYAKKMGKTPIVVNDCPGFFVNRVLFPYFGAFDLLLKDGVDFVKADKVMEKFGWPMGPAYLTDVVGIDVSVHAGDVMAEGFPDRLAPPSTDGFIGTLFKENRLGQKNGKGYYSYEPDRRGRIKKVVDETTYTLLKATAAELKEFDAEDIIARLMVPMCNEVARCLEEHIIASPQEADMALLMGLGFPPFRGGVCRHLDSIGLDQHLALCEKFSGLGAMYQAPKLLKDMAAAGKKFFG